MEPTKPVIQKTNYYCNLIHLMTKIGCSAAPLYRQPVCLENVQQIYSECLKKN